MTRTHLLRSAAGCRCANQTLNSTVRAAASLAVAGAATLLALAGCATQPGAEGSSADGAGMSASTASTDPAVLEVIAFGSCAYEREPQPLWDDVIAQNPDLFLFIGDNMYADTRERDADGNVVVNREIIQAGYDDLAAQPGWQALTATCPVMATWDDHDYGLNDAGEEFAYKYESAAEFIEFFGMLPGRESPQLAVVEVGEGDGAAMADATAMVDGIYNARIYGPEGRRVQVIMLDTRFFRSPLTRVDDWRARGMNGPYTPGTSAEGTMLGEAQWAWLEAQLSQPAEVRIIGSSIQVVADQHGWECWGNMPHERQRLYDLIDSTGAGGVVFISGDRHLMEISRETDGPYPLWDFTSSGINQRDGDVGEPNVHRYGPVHRTANFGIIRIDWQDELTVISLEGYTLGGERLTTAVIPLYKLSAD